MRHAFDGVGRLVTAGADGDWGDPHVAPVVAVAGTTHTVVAADAGKLLRTESASATTVTVDNLTPGQWIDGVQAGVGQVTFAAGGSFTINSRGGSLSTNGQWSPFSIICDATDHATISGDLA